MRVCVCARVHAWLLVYYFYIDRFILRVHPETDEIFVFLLVATVVMCRDAGAQLVHLC